MIITYYGKQFFKIVQGDMSIAFNPVSRDSNTGITTRFGSDLAFVTTNHPDYNGLEQLSYGDKIPFAITGPGDYEVKEIFIKGVMSDSEIEKKKYINTVYSLTVDNINLAFLGALSSDILPKEVTEVVNEPDILFIPVDGESGMLDMKGASKIAGVLNPKIIIPMDYDEKNLKLFLKEMGEENAQRIEKLTIKRKDLEDKEKEVVVLTPVK